MQKLFEKQYELRWHTTTGDPDQFSFYGFCQDVDQAGGENVMTYNTRRAHVISRLYHAQEELLKIRGLTYREHCPPVYVRTKIDERWTWKKWICHPHRREFEVCAGETDIDWISNEPLRNYITVIIQCKIIIMKLFPTEKSIFYWAVIEEDDFEEPMSLMGTIWAKHKYTSGKHAMVSNNDGRGVRTRHIVGIWNYHGTLCTT